MSKGNSMLKSPSGCSKGRMQKKKFIPVEELLIPFCSIMRNKERGQTWGGRVLLGLQCVTQETQAPHGRPHQMILCGATLCSSHSVIKPTIRFQGNEWPSQFKGFSLRWRQQKSYRDGSGCLSSFVSVTVLLRKYERLDCCPITA